MFGLRPNRTYTLGQSRGYHNIAVVQWSSNFWTGKQFFLKSLVYPSTQYVSYTMSTNLFSVISRLQKHKRSYRCMFRCLEPSHKSAYIIRHGSAFMYQAINLSTSWAWGEWNLMWMQPSQLISSCPATNNGVTTCESPKWLFLNGK